MQGLAETRSSYITYIATLDDTRIFPAYPVRHRSGNRDNQAIVISKNSVMKYEKKRTSTSFTKPHTHAYTYSIFDNLHHIDKKKMCP